MLRKLFIVAFLLLTSGCASTQPVGDSSKAQNDPWQGQYQHFSGRFILVLDHISKEFITADIFELSRLKEAPPSFRFAADLKDDKAIFQAGRGEKCRFELQLLDRGIMFSNFCNGTGEEDGLYLSIDKKAK